MHTVYLALGTNLGDRIVHIQRALMQLFTSGIVVTRCSAIWETEPFGITDQPWFLNAVVEAQTSREPLELLRLVKELEATMGREPAFVNGPRIIDIDLLFSDDTCIQSEELILPHPRIAERRFVLEPMVELAPDWKHPISGLTMRQLLDAAPPLAMFRHSQ